MLGLIPHHAFVVAAHVRDEVTYPEQRAVLDATIAAGGLRIEDIRDLGSLTLFAELTTRLGRGEAACIALAAHAGMYIASDEKRRFLRAAEAHLGAGRVLTTADLFVLAIRAGLLSVNEADADKAALEARRFKLPFASFRERLA